MSAPIVPPSLKKRGGVFDFAGKISSAVEGLARLRGAVSALTNLKEDALPKEKTVNFFYTMRWLAPKGHAWTEVAAPATDKLQALQLSKTRPTLLWLQSPHRSALIGGQNCAAFKQPFPYF